MVFFFLTYRLSIRVFFIVHLDVSTLKTKTIIIRKIFVSSFFMMIIISQCSVCSHTHTCRCGYSVRFTEIVPPPHNSFTSVMSSVRGHHGSFSLKLYTVWRRGERLQQFEVSRCTFSRSLPGQNHPPPLFVIDTCESTR